MSSGSKIVKVAFVGAGAMCREHARSFGDIPGVELVGISSRTLAKAEEVAREMGIKKVYPDIESLYEGTRADLVVIAVPELSIRTVAQEAFQQDWTILMEKPPGHTLDEAVYLQQLSRELGRSVYVALNRRYLSSTEAVREDLESREEVRFIRVEDQQSLEVARQLGHPEAVVQHWMYANSIHLVDYLCHLGRGPVRSVKPLTRWDPESPGVVLAQVEFDGGDVGIYEGVWNGPGPWAVTVCTPSRRWEIRPLEQARYINVGERKVHEIEVSTEDKTFKPGFRRQAEEVLRAVRGEKHRATSLEQAMESMKLVRAIFGV
ncbi:MAG: Gfo/Idh/MocA family oxidoreductase [Blastochloris sp.]|nr:Gfo/Idh/MocA family oxidoreductase [Blastochloris sp.]